MNDSSVEVGTVRPRSAMQNERHIPYKNLRDWLEEAEKLGEVKYVEGATWERDIGMATEVVQHNEKAPCVVFSEVPGTLEGSRLLVNFFAGKRMNMTLGFPSELSKIELSEAFRSSYVEDMPEIPHEIVSDGPIGDDLVRNFWHILNIRGPKRLAELDLRQFRRKSKGHVHALAGKEIHKEARALKSARHLAEHDTGSLLIVLNNLGRHPDISLPCRAFNVFNLAQLLGLLKPIAQVLVGDVALVLHGGSRPYRAYFYRTIVHWSVSLSSGYR